MTIHEVVRYIGRAGDARGQVYDGVAEETATACALGGASVIRC